MSEPTQEGGLQTRPYERRRLLDWPERLAAFLEARRTEAKQWGYNDCALFCADAIEAVTGRDPGWMLRGYDTPGGALKALVRFLEDGGGRPVTTQMMQPDSLLIEVASRIAANRGFEPIAAGLAQRGDAVLLDVQDLLPPDDFRGSSPVSRARAWTVALGIIGMQGLPVTAGEAGTLELPAERIVKAWRI